MLVFITYLLSRLNYGMWLCSSTLYKCIHEQPCCLLKGNIFCCI